MLVVIGRGTRHLTGQNWILLAGEILKTGFGTFLVIFDHFLCFFMNFDGFGGFWLRVGCCVGRGNGGGALGHPVSSGPVSRLPGTQKPLISAKFYKNRKVQPMAEL